MKETHERGFKDHPECSPPKPGADEYDVLEPPTDPVPLVRAVVCEVEGCGFETVHPSEVCGRHRDD